MYQAFYKLTSKPFRLSPDPAFFFPSRGHKRALAYLRYGLNQDEGFVVITGSPGTGKTTLAKILLQEMDAGVVVAHLTTTQLEADDMLRMVAASFGLRYEGLDKAGLLKSLENFLLARSRERKRALLVIDEAQNLPPRSLEELRMLSNLQVGDKALLQIFLLGQEQFRNMLDDPALEQLRQRVIANYHLTPLAADECQRYIESRLQHVGWNNDPHFAEIAHELIHEYTDGIPRRINMLCDRILLFGCMEETHEITGEVVNLVKTEMDEEISGKSPEQVYEEYEDSNERESLAKPYKPNKPELPGMFEAAARSNDGPDSAALNKPGAKPELTKNPSSASSLPNVQPGAQPKKYELLKSKTDESEKLGIMSTSFDNAGVEDDLEELDIDYALFEEKDTAETVVKTTSENQPAVVAENKIEEQRAQYSTAKKEEKRDKKAPQTESKKPPLPQPDRQAAADDKRVMGNTVQKTKPEPVKSEEGDSSKPSEISERDLFRVIPGGKSFGKIPGLGDPDKPGMVASAKSEPSSSDVKLRRILRLVLAFHRSPSRFPGLDSPLQPLPEGITELLELAISDDQVLNQVSPAAVMGISPVMLRAAVRFFVRRALFTPEGDHYRCLGLQPGASHLQIEKHYDLLMRLLRQDKQRGSADSVERVGQAYEALSRGEQGSGVSVKTAANHINEPVFDDGLTPQTENEKDISDILIDFEEVEKNPPRPTPSTFVAKPNERFNPVANAGVSRKTVRYASQFAVLGFGALVIILGLYIVQLEPSNAPNPPKAQVSQKNDIGNAVSAITDKEGSLPVAGSPQESNSAQKSNSGDGLNTGDNPAIATMPTDAQSEIAQIEAMRRELLARRRTDTSKPNYERPLSSTLETDTEQDASEEDNLPVGSTDNLNQKNKAVMATPKTTQPEVTKPQSPAYQAAKPEVAIAPRQATPAPRTNTPPVAMAENTTPANDTSPRVSSQPKTTTSNRFEGKDIEIVENTPTSSRGRSESFSSIAARTPIPKVEAPKPATPNTVSPPPPASTGAAQGPSSAGEAPAQVASTQAPTSQGNAASAGATKISESALSSLVSKFIASYESGSVDNVMSLFASDARTNNRTNAREIQSDYIELFKSTSVRKMSISGLNWKIESDYARGVGDYRAQINPVSSQSSQTFSGNITIQVQKEPTGLKISRFYFSNQSVSSGPRIPENTPAGSAPKSVANATPAAAPPAAQVKAAPIVSGKPPVNPASVAITAQDLQSLVVTFAQSYANGNIDGLMGLFASNAKTNDQNTLAGIRKDYVDLFQGSAARQMIISNMKWTLVNNQATGEGPFEVRVKAKGSNSMTSVKGTLKMTVVKNNNGAKITEMVHNVQ